MDKDLELWFEALPASEREEYEAMISKTAARHAKVNREYGKLSEAGKIEWLAHFRACAIAALPPFLARERARCRAMN